jgi:HrpA-like RNA helicase
LSSTILTLKGMGIKDPVAFDYMDAPDTDKIVAGLRMLYLYGAINADGDITTVGRDMALFPLEEEMLTSPALQWLCRVKIRGQ